MASVVNYVKHFKIKNIINILYKLVQEKTGKGRYSPTCFMNQYNHDTKQKILQEKKEIEHYLMNMDTKTFSKILANQIQQYSA